MRVYKTDSFELDRDFTNLLKFFSCILIALHHYAQYAIGQDSLYNKVYHFFAWQGGYIGVAVFFLLSGYGLMKSEMARHLTPNDFLKRRILKVYLPVVIVSFLWLPVYKYMWPNKYTMEELIKQAMGGGLLVLRWSYVVCACVVAYVCHILFVLNNKTILRV